MVDRARVVAPVLVGRDAELESLAQAVASPPAVVTVAGEAGIGKTRLVSELAALPEMAGRRWLVGACRRVREPFPLAPVLDAVRRLDADLARLDLSPVAGALRPLLPELADVLPSEPSGLGDRAAERHRVFRALVEVLSRLGPTVLVLEDLHWCDEQTLEFIAYTTAEPPADLALVLTFRPEEVQPSLPASIAKLPRTVRRTEVLLGPLDALHTGALGAAILDTDHISHEFAEHLCVRASGVPFAIEELLALLQARGTLVHDEAGWARRALDELDIPSGIRDPVLERVSRLSGPARAVIEAAAVLDVPATASGLASVAAIPDSARAIDEAVAGGLLTEHAGKFAFRHVLSSQAVYEALPSQHRAELHSRAAAVLEELDPVPLGELAHHLKRAGNVAEWMHAAEAAACAALTLGDDAEAAHQLEQLLREAPLNPTQRCRVALTLGRAAYGFRAPIPGLLDLLAPVLEGPMSRTDRGELRFWLSGVVQNSGGDAHFKRQLLAEAVEDLEDRPDLKAWAMTGLGVPTHPEVPVAEHQRWLARALETLPEIDDDAFQVFLLGRIAMSLAFLGDPAWRHHADEMLARAGGAALSRREADAFLRLASLLCYLGHYRTAELLLTTVRRQQDAGDDRETRQILDSVVAVLDFFRGDWQGLPQRVERLLEEVESPVNRVDVEMIAGSLALARGEMDLAHQQLANAAVQLERVCDLPLLAVAVAALARHAVVTGESQSAMGIVDRVLAILDAKELLSPLTRALPDVTQLLVATRQEARARSLIDAYGEALAGLDAPLGAAALAHARGLCGEASGAFQQAAQQLLEAADEYARWSCTYEAAQAREHAAQVMFAIDAAAAEEQLRMALAAYRDLGAAWDVARCERMGREHGVRLAATHRRGRKGYGDALSPREDEVARLAAEGLTNKEIAAELYLSPKTIDKHLGRAMAKLGVRTRAAIAKRLVERAGNGENGAVR